MNDSTKLATLSEGHQRQLRESGIPPEQVEHWSSETDPEVLAKLLGRRKWPGLGGGLVMNYLRPDGSSGAPRVRRDEPRPDRERPEKMVRYENSVGSSPEPYMSPKAWPKYDDFATPLIITEGEKKHEAVAALGFTVLSLPGIHTFSHPGDRGQSGSSQKRLHPLIAEHVELRGRCVRICFDHDSTPKKRKITRRAAERLAELLYHAGAAQVELVQIPGPESEKVGIDDFIVRCGAEAAVRLLGSGERVPHRNPVSSTWRDAGPRKPVLQVVPDHGRLEHPVRLYRACQFRRIPQELLRRSDMSAGAKVVFAYLSNRKDQRVFLGHIAKGIGVSKSTVQRAISQLEKHGYLKVQRERRRIHQANRYLVQLTRKGNFYTPLHVIGGHVSLNAVLVATALNQAAGEQGWATRSYAELSAEVGLSPKCVCVAARELREKGIVDVDRERKGIPLRYWFLSNGALAVRLRKGHTISGMQFDPISWVEWDEPAPSCLKSPTHVHESTGIRGAPTPPQTDTPLRGSTKRIHQEDPELGSTYLNPRGCDPGRRGGGGKVDPGPILRRLSACWSGERFRSKEKRLLLLLVEKHGEDKVAKVLRCLPERWTWVQGAFPTTKTWKPNPGAFSANPTMFEAVFARVEIDEISNILERNEQPTDSEGLEEMRQRHQRASATLRECVIQVSREFDPVAAALDPKIGWGF